MYTNFFSIYFVVHKYYILTSHFLRLFLRFQSDVLITQTLVTDCFVADQLCTSQWVLPHLHSLPKLQRSTRHYLVRDSKQSSQYSSIKMAAELTQYMIIRPSSYTGSALTSNMNSSRLDFLLVLFYQHCTLDSQGIAPASASRINTKTKVLFYQQETQFSMQFYANTAEGFVKMEM